MLLTGMSKELRSIPEEAPTGQRWEILNTFTLEYLKNLKQKVSRKEESGREKGRNAVLS